MFYQRQFERPQKEHEGGFLFVPTASGNTQQGTKKMKHQEKFKKLSAAFCLLSGRSYGDAWNDAQDLKDQVRDLISDVFSDMPMVRDQFLFRLRGKFVNQPSFVLPDGTSSPPIPDAEHQRIFEADIADVHNIMDGCCIELKRLAEKYR